MNSIFLHRALNIAGTVAAALCCFSCISSTYNVGGNLIPTELKYDTYTAEFPLEDIRMAFPDSLSGYSSRRITIGAIRDELFGLTTRGCAISLVPMSDTLDFGKDPELINFHFSAARDTISVADHNQDNILQNINVYELSKPLDFNDGNLNNVVEHSSNRITKRTPVYDGTDSLSFDFSADFARKYLTITQDDLADLETYTKKFPGIYIDTDEPIGMGGRINMFNVQLGLDMENYQITGDFATLSFNSEYDGERKDTSFYFWFCPDKMYDLDSLISEISSDTERLPQYSYNVTGHSTRGMTGESGELIAVEGGGGLKPVISATEIKNLIENEISKYTDQPREAIINRASIIMPFEFPDDYEQMFRFPTYLNPTVKVRYSDDYVSYGSLTDTSSSYEDPGDLNRSLCQYAPDVTYHIQKLLELNDLSNISNYDIWLLVMADELERYMISGSTSSSSSYYQQLAYASYYNSLYGGYGYSGYGYSSYGYGNSYLNNYYYMSMLASAYSSSSSSSSSSYSTLMDKDRYYCAILNGPKAERHPTLKIVYSVPCSIAK
jgi:hypothetical protein